MALMQDFETACRQFREFRALVDQAQAVNTDPTLSQLLDELVPALDKSFADTQKAFPAAVTELQDRITTTERSLHQSQNEIAALEQQIAAAEQELTTPPPEPPPPPPLAVDPAYTATLRSELLDRFGLPLDDSQSSHRHIGEVWEDWEEYRDAK